MSDGSSKIELFWDPHGNGDGSMVLVDAIYTASETYNHTLDETIPYDLDGTACFRVRRTVLGGILPRQVYAQVQGFTA
ncbi:hypothetical protein ACSTH4_23530, partial [Vibrio parahaemolyticus]